MRKLKLDKNIIFAAVASAILLVEIVLTISGIGAISGINKNISKVKQDLATIEKEWPNKENYVKKADNLKKEITAMREKFIQPQQDSALFSYISSESKNFSVQLKSLKPQPLQDYASNKLGKFKCLPIAVSATSSFHNFARFMDFLQNGRYFFDVLEMRILSDSPYHSIEMIICGLVKEN
ncbi:MAG: type 4a pilus biogenesis protein PilO [Candidatus Omnitrophica bacterium]|nr:type 4a pilus biogenesis protein PilO [Candidatus Omnitrophota bacterium]